MSEQDNIIFISSSLAQGKTKEEIYLELLNRGHKVDSIRGWYRAAVYKDEREDTQKRTVRIIVTIGAVLIGAGVFSFIAANWQEIAKPLRVSIIIAAMLLAYGMGWFLQERLNILKTGESLILLGTIMFGAAIFLVAQMFNVRANWPDGFIIWMMGTLAMAFAIKSNPLYYLSLALGVVSIIGHPFKIFNSFGTNPFLLTSSFLLLAATAATFITGWKISRLFFPLSIIFFSITLLAFNRDLSDPLSWRVIILIASVAGLVITYLFKTAAVLFQGLIGIGLWLGTQSAYWAKDVELRTSSVLMGLLFLAFLYYVIGHLHKATTGFKSFVPVYLVLGLAFTTGALLYLSTQPGLSAFSSMTGGGPVMNSWRISTLLVLEVLGVIGLAFYAFKQRLIFHYELGAILILTVLFGTILLLPQQDTFLNTSGRRIFASSGVLSSTGVLWAIIFNIIVFLELLGLIFSGYIRRNSRLINTGSALLLLLILIKYFDWFFNFLDKSIFFIGAGVLLFVIGWFMEKGRRHIISDIRSEIQNRG